MDITHNRRTAPKERESGRYLRLSLSESRAEHRYHRTEHSKPERLFPYEDIITHAEFNASHRNSRSADLYFEQVDQTVHSSTQWETTAARIRQQYVESTCTAAFFVDQSLFQ